MTGAGGSWIELSSEVPYPTVVASLVPPLFEAYARVAHPPGFVGVLPEREFSAVFAVLRKHTSSDRLVVGLWEGFLDPDPGPTLELMNRRYVVAEAAFDELGQAPLLQHGFSPNIAWPDDRAWFLSTDIDLPATYVGGSAAAIRDVLAANAFDAAPVAPDDGLY